MFGLNSTLGRVVKDFKLRSCSSYDGICPFHRPQLVIWSAKNDRWWTNQISVQWRWMTYTAIIEYDDRSNPVPCVRPPRGLPGSCAVVATGTPSYLPVLTAVMWICGRCFPSSKKEATTGRWTVSHTDYDKHTEKQIERHTGRKRDRQTNI